MRVRELWGEETVLLVMPSDHLVRDSERFARDVARGRSLAGQGYLVTFGVFPTHAETGYGYIHQGEALGVEGGYRVAGFVEKPDELTARRYLDSGAYFWNSGMFCFQARAVLDALREHAPEVLDAAARVWDATDGSGPVVELPGAPFKDCPSISIDYAVMERAGNNAVVVGDFGWSDIGCWRSLSELYDGDEAGNAVSGTAVLVESRDCFVQAGDCVVAAVGGARPGDRGHG